VQQALEKLFSFNAEANWKATQNLFEFSFGVGKIGKTLDTLTSASKRSTSNNQILSLNEFLTNFATNPTADNH